MYEETKHRCGVRQLCKLRKEWGLQKFRLYLTKYKLDDKLLQDFYTQYEKGNRGEVNKWL